MTTNQTAPVTDEELDQMIWKLERDGMTPKQLSLMKELREVRRAKGEPVAYADPQAFINFKAGGARREWMWRNPGEDLMPLYTVPPAPVVPDEQYQHLSELYHAQEKRLFKIAQRIKGPAFDKYAYSPSQAIDVLESAIFGEQEGDCAAMLSPGNSEQLEPVSNRDELPAKCWCHTCRPVTMNDMRFVVCPECGNKRCPRANDHRNACTGSNAPGQDGSAYPAAPKEVG